MAHDLNSLSLPRLFERVAAGPALDALLERAREEDLGTGDVTCELVLDPRVEASAEIRARQGGVLAGAVLLPQLLPLYDRALELDLERDDGATLRPGDRVASLRGPLRSLLAAERVLLNFLAHLSGIASLTARCVEAVAGTRARIYDTRKTVPGLRGLAKYAVRCGGGFCHRIGLYDAVLVKDNHLAGLGSDGWADRLHDALGRARSRRPPPDFVEVEVDTLEQLRTVLKLEVDVVLLDNMPAGQMAEAVRLRDRSRPAVRLEASGGVGLETVRSIAETGVDRIAIGALTHSAPALDLGLDMIER